MVKMNAKIIILLEDIDEADLNDLADELRNKYSKTRNLDNVVAISNIPEDDKDFEYLREMRIAMGYTEEDEDTGNRTNCLGYEICAKYSGETDLNCQDCDNFKPVIEGVEFSHAEIEEGVKRWQGLAGYSDMRCLELEKCPKGCSC